MGLLAKSASFALLLAACPAMAAPPVPNASTSPAVREKDTWVYVDTAEHAPNQWRQTHDEVSVVHVMDDAISVSAHQVGSSNTPAERILGRDWSRFRSIGGKEVVVNRPLLFPLEIGKTWDVQYVDDAPAIRTHKSETYAEHYRVVGLEDVDVPAGHFHAIKIEDSGRWSAIVATGATAVSVSHADAQGAASQSAAIRPAHGVLEGRIYRAIWYVPEVHRWVKSVEEVYDSNGSRSERTTSELESWRPAP